MKVAIPVRNEGLSAKVERQFGRCDRFILVDSETLKWRAVPNKAKVLAGGAGIAAAQQILEEGAEVVLAGELGPNAADVLSAAHVVVYTSLSGTVEEALEALESGGLEDIPAAAEPSPDTSEPSRDTPGLGSNPTDPVHVGTRRDCGQGRGRGRGRRGRRRGRARSQQLQRRLQG